MHPQGCNAVEDGEAVASAAGPGKTVGRTGRMAVLCLLLLSSFLIDDMRQARLLMENRACHRKRTGERGHSPARIAVQAKAAIWRSAALRSTVAPAVSTGTMPAQPCGSSFGHRWVPCRTRKIRIASAVTA